MQMRHRQRNSRRLLYRCLAVAGLGLAAGCTIMTPVQTPQADRRFALNSGADSQANGHAPCKPARADAPGECAALDVNIDTFHGGLGRVLWETDVRRRQLIGQAAAHTNINASYNALLWPLGAYFIHKKIRDPGWSALDVAAVAAASYGFLDSGIPDRDRLYIRTAARMACSMTLFDADLYLATDIRPSTSQEKNPAEKQPAPGQAGDTLLERLTALQQAAQDFSDERERVLLHLKLAPQKSGPSARNEADRRRLDAKGLTSAPKAQKDPSKDFLLETDILLKQAQEQLVDAGKLMQRLDDAGDRLRRQRVAIEGALTQALNERTPALRQPTDVGARLFEAFEAGVASERKVAARIKKESGAARAEGWMPTQARLADLEEASREQMTCFWSGERVRLKLAMARLAEWTARHDERRRQSQADASSMGCEDGDLATFARSLGKAAESAGGSASTSPKPEASP